MFINRYDYTELQIGLSHTFTKTVTAAMLQSFIQISGDINPLHTNEEYAKSQQEVGKVVHGLLTATFYSTLVGVYLPGERCLLQSINIQFKHKVFVGEQLTIYGEIVYLNDLYRVADIKANIKNASGIKVSVAKIQVGIR